VFRPAANQGQRAGTVVGPGHLSLGGHVVDLGHQLSDVPAGDPLGVVALTKLVFAREEALVDADLTGILVGVGPDGRPVAVLSAQLGGHLCLVGDAGHRGSSLMNFVPSQMTCF
jgi:hypothetical protein